MCKWCTVLAHVEEYVLSLTLFLTHISIALLVMNRVRFGYE